MKIVSINVHYQDGLGYQDYYLGKALKKMGHELHYIASDKHFDFPDYDNTVKHIIGDKYVGKGLFTNEFGAKVHRLEGTDKSITGAIWLKGLNKKLIELNPDLVISHGVFTYHSIRLLFLTKKLNCQIIFDDHTTINLIRKSYFSYLIYSIFRVIFAKKILKKAYKIIGISQTCMDVLDKYFGLSGKKVSMVPLGSDIEIFKPDINLRKNFRSKVSLNDDDCLIVYTGKIYQAKNPHLIIDALNDLHGLINYNVKILFVGEVAKDYSSLFISKINKSVYPVTLNNTVSQLELSEIYNGADICVWPDHLTTSTIDASACGSPIICSHFMPERVKYDNGFLVKAGDLSDLKDKLKTLIQDRDLRVKMGKNGYQYVLKELSWDAIAQSFIS